MFYIFILMLSFASSAFADFKNELPSDFPTQVNEPSSSSTQPSRTPVKANPQESNPSANQGAFSQEIGNHDSKAPVYFTGKYGDGSRKTGVLNLIGEAVIIQDDTTLKSNKAQILSDPGSLPSSGVNRVKRALASGNVRIFKKLSPTAPEIKATGDEADFLVADRVLILRGKAKVWRAKEYLNGDSIQIELNSGDIHIIRPEGTVDPRSANNSFNHPSKNTSK